jgi:hypothetical protein
MKNLIRGKNSSSKPIVSNFFLRKSFLFSLFIVMLLCDINFTYAQEKGNLIIGHISELEGQRDPKCHATASRLEDFMYGTPLSFEARNERINIQKKIVKQLWLEYSHALEISKNFSDSIQVFNAVLDPYFSYKNSEKGITVQFPKTTIQISQRDYRQYSSVAYTLRAILSVNQAALFSNEKYCTLNDKTLQLFKETLDIFIISLLQQSDVLARKDNSPNIELQHIQSAFSRLIPQFQENIKPTKPKSTTATPINPQTFHSEIIQKKLESYKSYNQISQAVFLRNIQVYFAKVRWPTEKDESIALKNYFTETTIAFALTLVQDAHSKALSQQKKAIEYDDIYEVVQSYLPHTINNFEDVTYFHRLGTKETITIEAYDLDALRDNGIHWQYLKFTLEDFSESMEIPMDPFAMEMSAEAIAQFSLLVFRLAGEETKKAKKEVLSQNDIYNAMLLIQSKILVHNETEKQENKNPIVSKPNKKVKTSQTTFTDVTDMYGISFEHRNSDWLNRLIRSYIIKEDEQLARLAIPPAFGGGGVAAEDINNDGWTDILLLSGKGNQLLINQKGKGFKNITLSAGLDWKRLDGTHGEPRQPIINDFDNDGWKDILITYANDVHRLYRNNGDNTFEDVTDKANLGGKNLIGGPATVLDVNNDGLLDIYIGYFGNYPAGELPTLKRHNTNGLPNVLLQNKGDFKFEDVSEKSGLQNNGWTQAVGHADINGDGWQDIIVGNDFGTNAYYINNQDGTFSDHSLEMGTDKPSYTMNIGIADLNQDQLPDFYISNIVVMDKDDKYVSPNADTKAHFNANTLATMRVVEANDLFISKRGEKSHPTYDLSKDIGRGYSATGWSWDADFFDYDNDGDEDLYCLTGMNPYSVYGSENAYFENEGSKNKSVTFANSNAEANILFENKGGLLEVVNDSLSPLSFKGTSRSAAYLDMDQDGDLDIIINDYQGSAKLFENHSEKNKANWVAIQLIGNPEQKVNKDAIGAKIILKTADGNTYWKEIHSTTGYLSVHPKTLYFGLGDNNKKPSLEIQWPNGKTQYIKTLEINQTHYIEMK